MRNSRYIYRRKCPNRAFLAVAAASRGWVRGFSGSVGAIRSASYAQFEVGASNPILCRFLLRLDRGSFPDGKIALGIQLSWATRIVYMRPYGIPCFLDLFWVFFAFNWVRLISFKTGFGRVRWQTFILGLP